MSTPARRSSQQSPKRRTTATTSRSSRQQTRTTRPRQQVSRKASRQAAPKPRRTSKAHARPASQLKPTPRAQAPSQRFWRWYRALPLVCLLLCFVVALVFKTLPASMARNTIAPVRYAQQIQDASARHGADPYLVCAVIKCESGWDPAAQSAVGAQGLMQVMPATAQELVRMGLVDGAAYPSDQLFDPTTNIEYGCAYLGYLTKQLSSQESIIAAYNAGIGQVLKWQQQAAQDGKPFRDHINFAETFAYVSNVTVAYHEYVEYYPEGIRS